MELRTSHYTLLQGHALDVLRTLPDNSVHCVNTSSPYYGLRSYGTEPVVWAAPDGAPLCEHGRHEWTDGITPSRGGVGFNSSKLDGIKSEAYRERLEEAAVQRGAKHYSTCTRCGAWRGELGQEPTPQLFIAHLVSIFREVRRVLRPDGVCFANIADSWAGGKGASGQGSPEYQADRADVSINKPYHQIAGKGKTRALDDRAMLREAGIQPKSAMLIPERFVIALQDDGWIVRMPIVWAKGISFLPNYAGSVMPESVTDRPTKSYEMIYMLAESARYYWDKWAVAEQSQTEGRIPGGNHKVSSDRNDADRDMTKPVESVRNIRSVWAINPEPSSLRHYAMQPSKIAETVIRAGTSERGVCPNCGAPWVRTLEKGDRIRVHWDGTEQTQAIAAKGHHGATSVIETGEVQQYHTTGWRPSCACPATEPVPATVLDPLSGAGTTGVVAKRLGRDYIGIELKAEYIAIAREHIDAEPDPLFVAESQVQPVSDESLEQLSWTLDS